MAKTRIAAILAFVLILQLSLSGCGSGKGGSDESQMKPEVESTSQNAEKVEYNAYTEEEIMWLFNGGIIVPASDTALTDTQRNSLNMLNYLTVLTQEISASSESRLYLEQAYSGLVSNTYPNAVDSRTQSELNDLLDTLEDFRMIDVKRERLEYIYEQNQAQAIRAAVPDPSGVLRSTKSVNLIQIATSVVYMPIDSTTSYQSAMNGAEQEYLQEGWMLDDEQTAILHNSRKSSFNYMLDMVQENGIPGEYALNETAVNDYVEWMNNSNVVQRIQFLENNRSIYEAYGPYWLNLAESYYSNWDYSKCLACVATYNNVQSRIFRKDYDYAKMLPLAIISANEVLGDENYVTVASTYADDIVDNTDYEDWALRYFAAQVYVELYGRTKDASFLRKAYDVVLSNVNSLVTEQRELNSEYLSDVVEIVAADDATKAEKEEVKDYNAMLREERKTAVPPVSTPLLLNCEFLFALADEIGLEEADRARVNGILHDGNENLFLIPQLDNAFWFIDRDVDVTSLDVTFSGSGITIPAIYLSNDASIIVTITDGKETTIIDDWAVMEVERDDREIDSFSAELVSETAKDFEFCDGNTVTVEIKVHENSDFQVLTFSFTGKAGKTFGPFGGNVSFERNI